ncbi:MAG: hypothetical protein FD157_1092 [Rhodocyclaceae bacterium]|nr:MAG: hypothetical protein FD157_1092 [Rhodocyclaceae bacterium]TND06118.1 MAG: hypothetical protein FD118_190 [Rhodocyclaceae bacterium]
MVGSIGKLDNAADARFGGNPKGRGLGGRIAAFGRLAVD